MKTFIEMNNRELFAVLAGNQGVMAQMELQNIVKAYLSHCRRTDNAHPDVDLQTMVKEYLEGTYQ